MRLLKYILFFASLLTILFLISCDPTTPQMRLQKAQENLTMYSPTYVKIINELKESGINYTITMGSFPNQSKEAEATTQVQLDGSFATIIIDESRVKQAGDRLEPVLIHELAHVQQAYLVYGVPNFIQIVQNEKNLAWSNRTVEKSAVVVEDRVRAELRSYKEFYFLTPYRKDIHKRT